MKTKTFRFKKYVSLCGIPYEFRIMPTGAKGEQYRKKQGIVPHTIACVDNNRRVIFLEANRKDVGYLLLHELIHAATESLAADPNSLEFDKSYGEEWTKPFSRVLWDMLQGFDLINKKFVD